MSRICRSLTAALACLAASLLAPSAVADALVDAARQRVDQGDAPGALALLEPLINARAGDAEFDYALALALIDSGDSLSSTLVFERLLLAKPDFHGARIDLGRAYFNLARFADAKRQFTRAQAAGPPPQAADLVARYLQEIERIERRQRYSRFVSLGTRAGYDSNVNSATELDEFLGFGLNEQSREQDSDFVEATVVAGGGYAVAPAVALRGRVGARVRRNAQASFADSTVFSGSLGLTRRGDRQRQSLTLDAFTLSLDGTRNSTALALTGDWRLRIADTLWVGPLLRFGQVRFQDSLAIKDVDQLAIGGVLGWQFGGDAQGTLDTSVTFGSDSPVDDNSRYARDVLLWNTAATWRFGETLNGALALSVERSQFDEVFFAQVFNEAREDLAVRLRGALDWRFAPRWRLQHVLSYRTNNTDIGVFEFERFEVSLGLRYVWY